MESLFKDKNFLVDKGYLCIKFDPLQALLITNDDARECRMFDAGLQTGD